MSLGGVWGAIGHNWERDLGPSFQRRTEGREELGGDRAAGSWPCPGQWGRRQVAPWQIVESEDRVSSFDGALSWA